MNPITSCMVCAADYSFCLKFFCRLKKNIFFQNFCPAVFWVVKQRKSFFAVDFCCLALRRSQKLNYLVSFELRSFLTVLVSIAIAKGLTLFFFVLYCSRMFSFSWANNCFLAYCSCSLKLHENSQLLLLQIFCLYLIRAINHYRVFMKSSQQFPCPSLECELFWTDRAITYLPTG